MGKPPYHIAQMGVGFVPDDRRIFPDLTVRQNLLLAKRGKEGSIWNLDRIYDLFPKLKYMESHMGGHLSGGEQQMLTIARTLMTNPDLLLLDEPGEGLAPLVIKTMEQQLGEIKKLGITLLICEHNVGAGHGPERPGLCHGQRDHPLPGDHRRVEAKRRRTSEIPDGLTSLPSTFSLKTGRVIPTMGKD